MAAAIDPMLKAIYLCDDFLAAGAGKVHLFGAFNSFTATRLDPPFTLRRLCIVAQLVGGLGKVPIAVEIVDGQTGQTVHSSPVHELQFATRHTTVYACFRVVDCDFPHEGVYFVELYCRRKLLEDRRLIVNARLEENE